MSHRLVSFFVVVIDYNTPTLRFPLRPTGGGGGVPPGVETREKRRRVERRYTGRGGKVPVDVRQLGDLRVDLD